MNNGGIISGMRYDTYCGLYCGACSIMVERKNNRLEAMADNNKYRFDELMCNGCKTQVNSIYCRECDIKKCAKEKNVEFCFECNEFPCDIITKFNYDEHDHHSVVLKNLNDIEENGIENWLGNQEKRWKCKVCETSFSWYTTQCKSCGSKVKDVKNELDKVK